MVHPNVVFQFINTSEAYMSTNATARVVEERREPVTSQAASAPQLVVTGQYLYEQFCTDATDATAITRMGIVRQLSDIADAFQLKGACDKMVELAREKDVKMGIPAKVAHPAGKKNKDGSVKEVPNRGPKCQQAMNTRNTIQLVWGGLKQARENMNKLGYSDETGFMTAGIMAKKALDQIGKTWKGDNVATAADKERKALVREQKAETQVFIDVQKATPREVGETFDEWQQRCRDLAIDKAEEVSAEKRKAAVKAECERLAKDFDENDQFLIATAILDRLGIAYDPSATVQGGGETPSNDVIDSPQGDPVLTN